ncbi:MAG: type VII secretion protein EccCa [Bifidobacteriaceae bacterium]|jgi:S-DNA-T family DNA segregation ATPase FtsK/SpoIIIE|nr:type VII secretion protein EccCa [Bifidobacteriaceae bacterium]
MVASAIGRAPSRLAPPSPPRGEINLEVPPELTASDGSSSLLTSLLPMLGSIGAVVMVALTGSGKGSYIAAGMFLLSSIGFVGINGWRQRSQAQAALLAQRREYLVYLTDLRETVRTAGRAQRRFGLWQAPVPESLVYLAEEQARLGERNNTEPDFLFARCGTGDQPLSLELVEPEIPTLAQVDPIAASACHRFITAHRLQHDLPVNVDVREHSRIEIVGPAGQPAQSLARAMICNLAVFHSAEDLQIAILAEPDNLADWEWAKWLPHVQSTHVKDGIGTARMIAPVLTEIADMLPPELADRPRFSPDGDIQTPHLLVVLDGCELPPDSALVGSDGALGVTFLALPSRWGQLEAASTLRIELRRSADAAPGRVSAGLVRKGRENVFCLADQLSVAEAEATARRLAKSAAAGTSGGSDAPGRSSAEITDLLRLGDIRDLDPAQAWRPRAARDRLRVPIGLTPEGRPIALDIKEAAQQGMGPHGLIIGATGSGKSEVLRTLVLALALTHSPEALNFVLADFKGGSAFNDWEDVPHVSAIITNLEKELPLVDRMQDALRGELKRRQELLREAGNFANVSEYNKARATERPDLAPLPALLIVVDEFSEMLSSKPDFADTFVQIGRLGRSLEVHLLLASQVLEEGKLKGLESHLSYRIGLKTLSAADSRTILGVPDAYELPNQPGVGYLKPDPSTLIRFRAAYVSGPPPRRRRARPQGRGADPQGQVEYFTAAPVAAAARPVEPEPDAADQTPEEVETRSTFKLAVGRMSSHGPQAHRIWLPPLVVPATLDQLMPDLAVDPHGGLLSLRWRGAGEFTIPVGVVDRPADQRQDTLSLSLSGGGGHLALVGAPRSGKSTFLRTIVCGIALTHTPLEAQFYVLDFGGGAFTPLAHLAHVAGVAARTDAEAVRRTVAEIKSILNARELFFREHGIDSIETYRLRRSRGQADDGYGDIFLVVDGWGTLHSEFELLEDAVTDITARGLTYGIHVIVSAARWLEIRQNVRDLLGSKVELRLGETSDSVIDRKEAQNVPLSVPGRGLESGRHHMLGALPRIDSQTDVASLADGVDALIAAVGGAWTGPAGPKLKRLPTLLPLAELQAAADPSDRQILLGLDEDELAPTGLDPRKEALLYLYGDSGSGKSTMLRAFAHEVMRLYSPSEAQIVVVDYRRSLLGDLPKEYLSAYLTTRDQASQELAGLAQFCNSRLPGPDVTPTQLDQRSWWTGAEVFVLVDDYDLVATTQGNPLAALAPALDQAADVGLHLALTRRSGGAARASFDPIIQKLTDLSATGILLSGSPDEGQLIGRVKAEPAIPGRAKVISRARGLFAAQLAFQPKARLGDE